MSGNVAHHFESAEQQLQAAKLGMWLFLATEVLLFGGLMCAYSVWVGGDAWESGSVCNRFVTITMPALIVVCSALRWPRVESLQALPRYVTPALAAVLVVAGTFALSPYRHVLLLEPPLLVEANVTYAGPGTTTATGPYCGDTPVGRTLLAHFRRVGPDDLRRLRERYRTG